MCSSITSWKTQPHEAATTACEPRWPPSLRRGTKRRFALFGMLALGAACSSAHAIETASECGVTAAQFDLATVAYLCDALLAVERYSLTVGAVDWPRIKAKAIAEAEYARSLDDVHPVIRSMLKSLEDNHSILLMPNRVAQLSGPTSQVDHAEMVPGARIAYIDLRGYFGTHRASMHAYVRALWSDLARAETGGACGYIIDLRRNHGGNMWPSLLALQPLLGVGNVGAFRSRDDSVGEWGLATDRATLAGTTVIEVANPPEHLNEMAARPVAVLLGPETASSAEAIAIAFRQRALTRSFGYHTFGATTANTGFVLKDNAVVNLAVADLIDRTGKRYAPYVKADEETTHERIVARPGGAKDVTKRAALDWLREIGDCRR